ncbi:UDP-2,3-diacylglucosamine diphosphatase LpxI [Aliiroseovarius sp. F47248L]|uniref:LpxI family protein n=1 Tax=Aliiroseovarius sp. F47248L TaxID=2926420 RepID=UPI001FF5C4E5|nr:UDP-2,3-diacylglucosamine diphosphatase LpxI [Aliiroseovarius sp. F47248L]MCK0138743.1 UDP-2,3-diacylglucosamine diphosphatase LpxI [Aliiroseovarius sp. F47248L]
MTTDRLAIIAGTGDLPHRIAASNPNALFVTIKGVDVAVPDGYELVEASYEKLGALFKSLRGAGVARVVFAGKVDRPKLNPLRMDRVTLGLFPRVKAVLGKGDDALLRLVAEVFEEQGFQVVAATDVAQGLSLDETIIGRAPSDQDRRDADRAWSILSTLVAEDLAQGAVVAGGQCLGIETIQGTDAMLRFVSETPEHLKQGARGVFVKRSKPGQDSRMDIPTIGPATIQAVAAAGLGGIVIPAGDVIVMEQDEVTRLIKTHDLFLDVRGAGS